MSDEGGGDLLLVGGNGHVTGRGGATSPRTADLCLWTWEHFNAGDPTHIWSAQDYVTASGLPFAGSVTPRRDDILVAGGYAKWGMTNGVAAALSLAARLLGSAPDWAEAFDPWSPRQFKGALDTTKYNAEVGLEMTRGWVAPVLPQATVAPPTVRSATTISARRCYLPYRRRDSSVLGRMPASGGRRSLERRGTQLGLPSSRVALWRSWRGPGGPRHPGAQAPGLADG